MEIIEEKIVSNEKRKGFESEEEKIEWTRSLRLKFTPKEMLTEEGFLDQEFFRPKLDKISVRTWSDKEKEKLYDGILRYGIGNWKDIISNCGLQEWTGPELSAKTKRIIGRQSIQSYTNWKGDKDQIAKEYNKNKEIGMQLGCWKGGVLVNDEEGKVAEALKKWNK
eukprot:TRINITY_DN287_c2_g1_i1.p1 TRINITY_DN287_c2_g1~~TRINITY_DN287_c2_g1_i1.p1  ORF type:complete len:166 (-),score=47.95 TRINITY_DN287_c2_g1_i1:153-650(-)